MAASQTSTPVVASVQLLGGEAVLLLKAPAYNKPKLHGEDSSFGDGIVALS